MKQYITYDYLLNQFICGVKRTENVDYSNKKSIRENNLGNTQYRDAAMQISKLYPERIEDFATMLTSDNCKIRVCCAVCLLEFMNCSKEQSNHALHIIRQHIHTASDKVEKTGFTIWLNNISSTKE